MAQTSTAINACDAGIWLDNGSGVLTNISGSSNQINMDFDQELGMFRVFGNKWPRRLECGKDARFSLQVVYSTAADEGADIIKDWYFAPNPGNRTLKVYLPNKNPGADIYTAEVKIDDFSAPAVAGSAEPIIITANLLPDGEVTFAQNAT